MTKLENKDHSVRARNQNLLWKACILIGMLVWAQDVAAIELHGASISYGRGDRKITAYRGALAWHWDKVWCLGSQLALTGYTELSYHYLSGKKGHRADSTDHLNAVALAPVFRLLSRSTFDGIRPYFEGAIGIAYLSDVEIGGRELGLHGQFEDRIGIGTLLGSRQQYDVNFRFMHFSNGFLGNQNDGINIYYLTLGYWWHGVHG
jgi:lipid A 3-O-deacylase